MGFGGSSLSYCASRLPATVMTTSSTLSPLAPPFTVDRAAPRPALNYDPYVPAWPPRPQPSDDSLHRIRPPSPSPPPASPPQPTHGPTTAAAVDALPYYAHGPALARASSGESSSWRNPSLALADPYYPCFNSAAATSAGDVSPFYGGRGEGSGGGSGCLGRHAVPSNVPSSVGAQAEGHRGNSAWIEREGTAVIPGYEDSFQQGTPALSIYYFPSYMCRTQLEPKTWEFCAEVRYGTSPLGAWMHREFCSFHVTDANVGECILSCMNQTVA